MPRLSLVAWEARAPSRFIFVAVPNETGRYVRTDACVALVPCEHCNATIGEPCRRNFRKRGPEDIIKYGCGTHWVRRSAAGRRHKDADPPDDVIDQADGANITIKRDA